MLDITRIVAEEIFNTNNTINLLFRPNLKFVKMLNYSRKINLIFLQVILYEGGH